MAHGPIRYKFDIDSNISVVVDISKADCNQEPAHCHICFKKDRVVQVRLDDRLEYKKTPRCELNSDDINNAIREIAKHRYELIEVYENNRLYGADYNHPPV